MITPPSYSLGSFGKHNMSGEEPQRCPCWEGPQEGSSVCVVQVVPILNVIDDHNVLLGMQSRMPSLVC